MAQKNGQWNLPWTLVLVLLLISIAELLARGPVRFAHARDFNDFISPFTQTRAWLKGIDPYSPANLVALWPEGADRPDFLKKDLADGSLVTKRGIPTAYPPTSFPLLALFAWLPWSVAHPVWLITSLLACVVAVVSLASRIRLRWQEKRTYLFVALALALAPFHTGLAAGSIVIVAVGACALAVWAVDRQQMLLAGILIGISAGLKPQIGLPFLAYYFLRRRWSAAATATIVVVFLAATAILRLTTAHVAWADSYRYDNRVLLGYGSLGDFTEANPIRFGLINLQVLFYTIVADRLTANLAAFAVTGVLGLVWMLLLRGSDDRRNELLELSTLVVLSLLPVYHRLYDASLLVFPLAWAWTALSNSLKPLAKRTVLLTLVFLVPGGTLLEQLQRMSYLHAAQNSWWWARLIMPHQVWALLLLSGMLLQAMRVSNRAGAGGAATNGRKVDLPAAESVPPLK